MNESTVPWANSARAKPIQIPMVEEKPGAGSRDREQKNEAQGLGESLQVAPARELSKLRRLDRTSIPVDLKALSNLRQGLMVFGHLEALLSGACSTGYFRPYTGRISSARRNIPFMSRGRGRCHKRFAANTRRHRTPSRAAETRPDIPPRRATALPQRGTAASGSRAGTCWPA